VEKEKQMNLGKKRLASGWRLMDIVTEKLLRNEVPSIPRKGKEEKEKKE